MAFLRELALSQTYQRSIEVSPNGAETATAAEQLAALQARRDQLSSTADESDAASSAARAAWTTAESGVAPLAEELAKAKSAVESALKPASDAHAAVAQAQAQLAGKQEQLTLLNSAAAGGKSAAEQLPTEAELAQALRSLSPSATPNPLMIALADTALARQGRMIAAIQAIGRGAEAFEGEAFAWDISQ